MTLSDRIEKLFMSVQKPVRYMGGEFNAVTKDPAAVDVRYAFLLPFASHFATEFVIYQKKNVPLQPKCHLSRTYVTIGACRL